jgi:ABC-2 type transport system permease protein
MSAFTAFYALSFREIIRFARQRSRWIGALVTPLLFWVFIGSGIGKAFQDSSSNSGGGYLHYFFPGMLLLSVLFTSIFSTISVIEDRHRGFLQGILVSPQPKIVFLLAKVFSSAFLATLQGMLLLAAAPFIGIILNLSIVLMVFLLLFLSASILTTVGFLLAWKIDSVAGYHSMMNLVLFPMWLMSGSLFPMQDRGAFFAIAAKINPLSYANSGIRSILLQDNQMNSLLILSVLALFTALSLAISYFYLEPASNKA